MSLDRSTLSPGDLLLYDGGGFIGWAIRVKTWSPVNHVEVYIGDLRAVSARASGSRVFDLDTREPYAVWRPTEPVDITAAMAWFRDKAEGQRYDWFGLFRFFRLGKQSTDHQFCSELATRFYRAGGFEPFAPGYDADAVAPGTFLAASTGTLVYRREAV